MRGLSLDALSEAMEYYKVSKNALAKYEKGEMMPSSKVLISLSKALNVPVDDFFRPITITINTEDISYRKRSSMGKKELDAINNYVTSELEKYIEVEQLSNETKTFDVFFDEEVKDENDAVSIAVKFRQKFKMGLAPITKPIELLESAGVKIIEVDASTKFDGDCFTINDVFAIVLNKNFCSERIRLSLFHEVGHKVMNIAEGVDEERMCNVFANEVLLPTAVFSEIIGNQRKSISLVELKELQKTYGISVDAMMAKAHQMGVVSNNRYSQYFIKKNMNPELKKAVDESMYPKESSERYMRLVYKLIANEVITESKGASLLNCSLSEVRESLKLV